MKPAAAYLVPLKPPIVQRPKRTMVISQGAKKTILSGVCRRMYGPHLVCLKHILYVVCVVNVVVLVVFVSSEDPEACEGFNRRWLSTFTHGSRMLSRPADCSSWKLPDLSSATAADLPLDTHQSRCAEVVTRQEVGGGPIWQPFWASSDARGQQKLQLKTCILETFSSGRKTTSRARADYIKSQP